MNNFNYTTSNHIEGITNEEFVFFQIADYFTNNKDYLKYIRKSYKLGKYFGISAVCLCADAEDREYLRRYFDRLSRIFNRKVKIYFVLKKEDLCGLHVKCIYISERLNYDYSNAPDVSGFIEPREVRKRLAPFELEYTFINGSKDSSELVLYQTKS